jgi:hypothetical protein
MNAQTAAALHLLDAKRDEDGNLIDPERVQEEVAKILAADARPKAVLRKKTDNTESK